MSEPTPSPTRPPLRFVNTLSRELETFEPLVPGEARFYTCGPTVYNNVHIGNLRTFLWEDLLRRVLARWGFRVRQVMNLTDIDDKTIRGSVETGRTLGEFTAPFIESFFEDLRTLRIQPAEVYPRATEHIPEMIDIIRRLEERGHTYRADDCVWFRISSFPTYGRLSRVDLAEARVGDRVASDEYEKEDARDFVLWKGAKPGEPESAIWDSPFGRGRPGWHIECSAMSFRHLGESFDIHSGAVDNIFPHHDNEIAQSEGASGKTFVRYWLHGEHLVVDGEKMAKSKGNFFTLKDLVAKGENPVAIRYLLLATPYRTKLNFTFEGLAGALSAVERWRQCLRLLGEVTREGEAGAAIGETREFIAAFDAALAEDLNTAAALGELFGFVRRVNERLAAGTVTRAAAELYRSALEEPDRLFDVLREEAAAGAITESEVEARIAERQAARKGKDFRRADEIRDELVAAGILLEDTPKGVRWKRKG
jgi:cysteinyl-tRNA synthetase